MEDLSSEQDRISRWKERASDPLGYYKKHYKGFSADDVLIQDFMLWVLLMVNNLLGALPKNSHKQQLSEKRRRLKK